MILFLLLVLAMVSFFHGVSRLEASAEARLSDSLYPDQRLAERAMDAVIGWLCIASGVAWSGSVLALLALEVSR